MRFPLLALLFASIAYSGTSHLWLASKPILLDEIDQQKRFDDEAVSAWKKYMERASRLQGTVSVKHFVGPERDVLLDRTYEIKQNNGQSLFIAQNARTKLSKAEDGWLRVNNQQYAFDLHRTTVDAPWVLKGLQTPPPALRGRNFMTDPIVGAEFWTTFPVTVNSLIFETLPPILAGTPGFKPTGFTPIEENSRTFLKVDFNYSDHAKTSIAPSVEGYIVYDPANLWVAREFSVKLSSFPRDPGTTEFCSGKMEYSDASNGFLIPVRHVRLSKTVMPTREASSEVICEFDLHEGKSSNDAFRLSGYGMSEPLPSRNRERSWVWWITIAGFCFLVTGILLRRLKPKPSLPA